MIEKLLDQLQEAIKKEYPKDTVEVKLLLNARGWQVSYKQGEGEPIKEKK